jgi:hypothetical protein
VADTGLIAALVATTLAAAPPATSPPPSAATTAASPTDSAPASPTTSAAATPAEPAPRAPTAVPAPNLSPRTSPTPEGPEPAPAVVTDRYTCHGSVPCQRLVALGAVTGAIGLAGLATGVALALRPSQVDPNDPTTAITYRPAGTAVLTIGLGVLTTSVLMLLTANRAARRALQKRTRQLSLR